MVVLKELQDLIQIGNHNQLMSNTYILINSQYHEELYQTQERKRKEEMKDFLNTTANVCTNGKDHTTMSLETYINEFINGPC